AVERLVMPPCGFERRVTKFERGQRLAEVAVVPFDEDLTEQRRCISRELFDWQAALIEVDQSISANQAFAVSVGADLDRGAAPGRADFKSRPVFGEGIWPLFIIERHRDQEFLAVSSRVGVVYVTNSPEIELVPKMIGGIA